MKKNLIKTKLLLYVTMILILLTILSCRRTIFEEEVTPDTNRNSQGDIVQINHPANTLEQLFPENGQAGGIESAGGDSSGHLFKADLYTVTSGSWNVMASLINTRTEMGINDADIILYCKISDTTYRKFKLVKKGRDGDYFLFRFNAPFIIGKRAGYFHIIDKTRNIDFKLGFGINKVTIGNLIVNGQRPISGKFIKVFRGSPLNISVTASGGIYYQVKLLSNAGIRDIYNYYAPGGNISIGQDFVSRTVGTLDLTIYAHNVYIARGFKTIVYPDNLKNISAVSVSYGNRISESTILEVQ